MENPNIEVEAGKEKPRPGAKIKAQPAKVKPIEAVQEKKAPAIDLEKKEPSKIRMTKDFTIEYPVNGRRGASITLRLKAGQEIDDKYLIKHLLQNPEAPLKIIE